jgi:acylphosphatase
MRVEGRVQGVGFRWWTQALGRRLGIRGWVRNLDDGSVEVHAAGGEREMAEFEQSLRSGPPAARVERLVRGGAPKDLPESDFEIRLTPD